MADDWGVNSDDPFFTPVAKVGRSLNEIVENLGNGSGPTYNCSLTALFPVTSGEASKPEVIPCTIKRKRAPSILKKSNSNKLEIKHNDPEEFKRVTFELEKFLAEHAVGEERSERKAQMAMRLGAVQPKGVAVNYKEYKKVKMEDKKRRKENPTVGELARRDLRMVKRMYEKRQKK